MPCTIAAYVILGHRVSLRASLCTVRPPGWFGVAAGTALLLSVLLVGDNRRFCVLTCRLRGCLSNFDGEVKERELAAAILVEIDTEHLVHLDSVAL